MRKKFVILCFPRTGSYLLTDLLGRQRGVDCHGELLKKDWIELDARLLKKLRLDPAAVESRDREPRRFIDSVFEFSSAEAVGFKMFPFQNQIVMSSLLEDHSMAKIFLGRNPLQTYISLCMANETDKWVRTDRLRTDKNVYVTFDESVFMDHLLRQRTIYERVLTASLLDSDNPIMFVDYKGLRDDKEMEKVGAFLGLDKWRPVRNPKYRKQLNRPYEEVIENWEDVEKFCETWNCSIFEGFHSFFSHFVSTLYGSCESKS